jgi:chemotaxis protein MotC
LNNAVLQSLPVDIAAQVELARGVLLAEIDAPAAVNAFVAARLAAPGSMVEEAALRREALLSLNDIPHFTALLKTYLRRFGASPFAAAFISQVAFRVGAAPPEFQDQISTVLDEVLAQARLTDRQVFFGILARTSLTGGHAPMIKFATERALQAAKTAQDEPSVLSARLYKAAFDIAGVEFGQAAIELRSLMHAPLQQSDQEILKAAIGVAKELRRWPKEDMTDQLATDDAVPFGPPAPESPAAELARLPLASVSAAEALLRDTKSMIEDSAQNSVQP